MLAIRQKPGALTLLVGPEDHRRQQAISEGLAPRLDYRLVAERTHASVQAWCPPPSGLPGPKWVRQGRSLLGNLRHARRLTGSLSRDSIVYSTAETWGLPVGLAALAKSAPRFTHVVYGHRIYTPGWLRFLRAARQLLAVDGWICVTRYQAGLLRGALGPGGALVSAIPQGVDAAFFDPAKASAPRQEPYVLAVGAEMRNYALFFEAVRRVDARAIVKASSAWMATARRDLTSVPPNVTMVTRRLSYVELRDLYAGAALVAVPLYDTPQAAGITTILEGMAMGKCVVATRSRGLPDILKHGETGVVVEPSADALADTLRRLLSSSQERDALADAGRRAAITTVAIEEHARQVADFVILASERKLQCAHSLTW